MRERPSNASSNTGEVADDSFGIRCNSRIHLCQGMRKGAAVFENRDKIGRTNVDMSVEICGPDFFWRPLADGGACSPGSGFLSAFVSPVTLATLHMIAS
jgi:hypothetical protein